MKITISVSGRFHAFDLARQLYNYGVLHRLITSYPRFKAMEWGIPKHLIESEVSIELLKRGWSKLPEAIKSKQDPSYYINNCYDQLAKSKVPRDTDIFIGWSGSSYNSLYQAKKFGAITILERGSTHILYQAKILKEEYKKYNITPKTAHPKTIKKELKEYSLADYISIPSQFVKDTFIQHGTPRSKLIVNPYGVDLSSFYPTDKKDNKFRVIFCGGLTLQKGVHYLLQAFYELKIEDAEFWLIGNINPEITNFLKKYKSPNIFLKGTFPQAKLYELYSQGSIFCLTSIQEGLAMVIPQAMACGLPVICTPNSGGGEIVQDGENGFIIPIRDIKSLKEKILILYKNRLRCEEMGVAARNAVKSGYSWDDYGKRAIKNYSRMI
jgi:glycosyltransferase involved in cell wall biosynthesis